MRNPDTGKTTMKLRPKEEWVHVDAPHLRIVPKELWKVVEDRRREWQRVAGGKGGRKPRYILTGLLVCAECGRHYVLRTNGPNGGGYYSCATRTNRGKLMCSNGRTVRRDRLEETLLRFVFDEVFSPDTVAYVSKKVNEALARRATPPDVARKKTERELAKAQAEAENIKQAVRLGKATATLLEMLEQAERRTAELEAALKAVPAKRNPATVLPSVVIRYLTDLRTSLRRDPERARGLLGKLLGPITLRRDGDKLVAEMRGNLPALLEVEGEALYNPGSPNPLRTLWNSWPTVEVQVA